MNNNFFYLKKILTTKNVFFVCLKSIFYATIFSNCDSSIDDKNMKKNEAPNNQIVEVRSGIIKNNNMLRTTQIINSSVSFERIEKSQEESEQKIKKEKFEKLCEKLFLNIEKLSDFKKCKNLERRIKLEKEKKIEKSITPLRINLEDYKDVSCICSLCLNEIPANCTCGVTFCNKCIELKELRELNSSKPCIYIHDFEEFRSLILSFNAKANTKSFLATLESLFNSSYSDFFNLMSSSSLSDYDFTYCKLYNSLTDKQNKFFRFVYMTHLYENFSKKNISERAIRSFFKKQKGTSDTKVSIITSVITTEGKMNKELVEILDSLDSYCNNISLFPKSFESMSVTRDEVKLFNRYNPFFEKNIKFEESDYRVSLHGQNLLNFFNILTKGNENFIETLYRILHINSNKTKFENYDFENLSFEELVLFLLQPSEKQNLILKVIEEKSKIYNEFYYGSVCFENFKDHKFYQYYNTLTTIFSSSDSEILFLSELKYLYEFNRDTLNILLKIFKVDKELAYKIVSCFNLVKGERIKYGKTERKKYESYTYEAEKERIECQIWIRDFTVDRFELLLNCIEGMNNIHKLEEVREWTKKCNLSKEIYKKFSLEKIEKHHHLKKFGVEE